MDKIFLHGMKVETLIGVYDWERMQKQTLIFDLDIAMPERAADNDDIGDTVHYGVVCARLREELAERDFLLLESLAEYSAALLLDEFNVQWVRVKIVKPGILSEVREVGVEIERRRG
ncbi:MAG: dihydroneopterin aldolase [Alysiella sp.]|uniref:dihydroneopterin aldolase n=1 Tax=Alysiella sp. TaxID=1872483 RepID=UPI0026DB0BFC|nr:dihydroneopterin aldolase [Alysiella sp.]MDO4434620.1 dihydroneopterin aldolase [Alysiella sp.]